MHQPSGFPPASCIQDLAGVADRVSDIGDQVIAVLHHVELGKQLNTFFNFK